MLCLKIEDKDCNTIALARGEEETSLYCFHKYSEGDKITLESSEKDIFVWLQFDDALGKSMIYLKDNLKYEIPFNNKRTNISPKAFNGNQHIITVKKARDFEINQYRNLSYSVVDHHKNTTYYPHVCANVETRGESVFAAQNAINGNTISSCHGNWPFESWGINRQSDAKLKLEFGRKVKIDRVIIYQRADFPHDNWWVSGKLSFSDGSTLDLDMIKKDGAQEFLFQEKIVEWLELDQLVKADDPSEFPALTQLEVYGVEFNSVK